MESKTRANHCEYFETKTIRETAQETTPSDPRAAFDALFKK